MLRFATASITYAAKHRQTDKRRYAGRPSSILKAEDQRIPFTKCADWRTILARRGATFSTMSTISPHCTLSRISRKGHHDETDNDKRRTCYKSSRPGPRPQTRGRTFEHRPWTPSNRRATVTDRNASSSLRRDPTRKMGRFGDTLGSWPVSQHHDHGRRHTRNTTAARLPKGPPPE